MSTAIQSKFNRLALGLIALMVIVLPAMAGKLKNCMSADEAAQLVDREVCVSAHVYDVVELADGTRFLDLCSPETPDTACHFTIESPWEDREAVGELEKYRDMNVQVRGIVRAVHGRAGILLSHARQFYGGPPRFRPNPALMRGFAADAPRTAIADPNLRRQGGHRAFMNPRDRVLAPQ